MKLDFEKKYKIQSVFNHYHFILNNYYNPRIKSLEYIFENYCMYYFMKHLFPYKFPDISMNFLQFIMNFSVIKFILIGILACSQNLSEDIIIPILF